jgi:hypothetical protein
MSTKIPNSDIVSKEIRQVSRLDEVAETIIDVALVQARKKLSVSQRDSSLAILLQRQDFIDYLKYDLAIGLAKELATNDKSIGAIYIYEAAANPDLESGEGLPQDIAIHLLLRVAKPTAALEAFVASMDRALTQGLKKLSESRFSGRASILDVNLVTEEDIQRNTGFSAILSSIFAPPLLIWKSDS